MCNNGSSKPVWNLLATISILYSSSLNASLNIYYNSGGQSSTSLEVIEDSYKKNNNKCTYEIENITLGGKNYSIKKKLDCSVDYEVELNLPNV